MKKQTMNKEKDTEIFTLYLFSHLYNKGWGTLILPLSHTHRSIEKTILIYICQSEQRISHSISTV